MARGSSRKSVDIEPIRHKDRRKNIPTEELRDFVAEDEARTKTILYPRDSSLDPQLVWKGKDKQDSEDQKFQSYLSISKKKYTRSTSLRICVLRPKKRSLRCNCNCLLTSMVSSLKTS